MKRRSKFTISFFIFALVIFIVWNRCGKIEFEDSSFKGIIKEMRFNDKQTPIVKFFNDKNEYVIPCKKGQLLVGDSLVKRKNSLIVEQYRDGEWINEHEW